MKHSPAGVFARGLAMGAADIVPGVSGGTIALITGIYERLLGAIVAADSDALSMALMLPAGILGGWIAAKVDGAARG